jgi:Pyruvate/2-oxoacid:ferredoxin oxidoreductase gamma subunit
MTKVLISGEGGQGVRVISHVMATLLGNLGYEVSLLFDYDSSVRGAFSVAHLIFDRAPIDNPVILDADILLELSHKAGELHAQKTICETGLSGDEEIPFSHLGTERFGREIFGNMIALGHLLKLLHLEAADEELAAALPLKYQQENLDAVHFGYNLKQQDLLRGYMSRKRRKPDHLIQETTTET